MRFRVLYNTHNYPESGATSGLLEYILEAEDREDAFRRIYAGAIPVPPGEKFIFYEVEALDYRLPDNYVPIPFDEIEAAL